MSQNDGLVYVGEAVMTPEESGMWLTDLDQHILDAIGELLPEGSFENGWKGKIVLTATVVE